MMAKGFVPEVDGGSSALGGGGAVTDDQSGVVVETGGSGLMMPGRLECRLLAASWLPASSNEENGCGEEDDAENVVTVQAEGGVDHLEYNCEARWGGR